jgi:hypothetical protein
MSSIRQNRSCQTPGGARILGEFRDAGEQGQTIPFTPVVGTPDDYHILQVDQRHDGLEDQRQDVKDARRLNPYRVVPGEGFLSRVEWTAADIAKNDPNRADD